MALLGMQADMQYKSYFPGHYTTRDLNLDSNDSLWLLNNTDKIFMNGHDYNGTLLLPSPHQRLVHNKEVLKQTMIEQEAVFRDQIDELHRLYWRQKELMDEMKSKLLKHQPQLETLPSNPLLSQNSCDHAQKTCHVSLPRLKPAFDRSCVSTAENNLSFSCFNDGESTHAGPDPAQTKFSLKGCELESKCMKFGKKILDLELPPDEYIDSEEDESLQKVPKVSGYPLNRISEIVNKSDQQPYDGSCVFNSVLQEDNLTPGSISFKRKYLADLNEPIKLEEEADSMSIYVADLNEPAKHEEEAAPKFKFLADLNEPIKLEEEAASMSSDFQGPPAGHREFPCQDLSQKSNSGPQVFSTDFMQNTKTRNGFETCSEGIQLETNKTQELPSYDNEAGQRGSDIASLSPGLSGEGSMSLEDVELKQTHKFPRSYIMDQSDRKACSEGSESLARELSSNSYPDIGTCQLISLNDVGNSEASSVLSWRKHVRDIMRTPIAIQALPCFKTSAPFSKSSKSSTATLGLTSKKYHHSNNLKSGLKFDGTSSHQRSFCNRSHSESKTSESDPPSISFDGMDCCNNDDLAFEQHGPTKFIRCSMDLKPAKDMNSNLNICSSGREKMLEDLSRGLPWLKTRSMCKRKRGRRSELSTRMESVLERANSSSLHDVELKKVEASNNSSGKLVLGVQKIYNKPHISSGQSSSHSSPSKTHQYPPEDEDIMDRVTDIQMDCDSVAKSRKQLTWNEDIAGSGVYEKNSDFGVAIDLNSIIDEHECSPALSLSTEIDLEAPASPENKERSPPRGESDENPVETPFQFSGKEDEDVPEDFVGNAAGSIMSGQKGGDVQEELVRIAAKAIVSISSCTTKSCPETAACKPSEPCWSDELYWFARLVSKVVDDPDSAFGVALTCNNNNDNDECLSDGLDYFEAMTLKLTETKVEEQWYKSNGQKDQKEEETGPTSLPSQTRGRMRRRRQQRKDFQSEILPSLASLSRYEVTEDLQTIEGLIEAANNTWGTVSTRNVGRTSRQKGRRRSCNSNITENTICSLIKQQTSCRENGTEERRLIGWGKITRRRRGPRCPTTNAGLIQGQVH